LSLLQSGVTSDEKRLLKHGLFWAIVAAGSWFLIGSIHSHVVSVIAVIAWWVFLYAIFYRDAQKKAPN